MHIDEERIKQDGMCTDIDNCDTLEMQTLLDDNDIKEYER